MSRRLQLHHSPIYLVKVVIKERNCASFIQKQKYLITIVAAVVLSNGVFPLNAHSQIIDFTPREIQTQIGENPEENSEEAHQVLKVRLETSGPDDEWIRFEIENKTNGMILSAYHTTRFRNNLLSDVVSTVVGAGTGLIPFPVFVPSINFHQWGDHLTLSLSFKPDHCPQSLPLVSNQQIDLSTCTIRGKERLILPLGLDIHAGVFTIEYSEEELIRTISFRIPSES